MIRCRSKSGCRSGDSKTCASSGHLIRVPVLGDTGWSLILNGAPRKGYSRGSGSIRAVQARDI